MAVSGVTLVTDEYVALATGSFWMAGAMYLVWAAAGPGSNRFVYWKKHNDPTFSEVQGDFAAEFRFFGCVYLPSNNSLRIVYDTDAGITSQKDSLLYSMAFDITTGAVLDGPTLLGYGLRPNLVYRGNIVGSQDILLSYGDRRRGSIYLRESLDGGIHWGGERPVLNNKLLKTEDVVSVPYDSHHVSILQVANDSRPVVEIGSYSRTRPLAAIVEHPSIADRFFVVESNQRGAADLSDTERGGAIVSPSGTQIFALAGARLGLDDTVGQLALLDTSGTVPTLVTSATDSSGVGGNLGIFSLVPAFVADHALPNSTDAVALAASNLFVYVAHYSNVTSPTTNGQLSVYNISSNATGAPLTGIPGVRAVAVGQPLPATPVIFVGTTETGGERLRIYTENALTPTLVSTHKMPARVNHVAALLDAGGTSGTLFVCMIDQLNGYVFTSLNGPLRMVFSIPLVTRGEFLQCKLTQKGNLVAAMGSGGVGVFDQKGQMLSQTVLSGVGARPWVQSKVYAIGDLVTPRQSHPYAPQRKYFKCTSAGTSNQFIEPYWGPTGTVIETSGPHWQEQGIVDSVVTQIAIDSTRKRIYAVGVVGGPTGTQGRVYTLKTFQGVL